MTDARTQVAQVAAEKNPIRVYHGTLAEDYDGYAEFVLVALTRSSTSAALAHVSPGAVTTGQSMPAGTPVSTISINGRVEIISMGTRLGVDYVVVEDTSLPVTVKSITPTVIQQGEVVDQTGATVIGGTGFAGPWRKFAAAGGLYNIDFEIPPPTIDDEVSDDNFIPYWDADNWIENGGHLRVIQTDSVGLGKVLRASIDSGSSSAIAWISQTIQWNSPLAVSIVYRRVTELNDEFILDIAVDWLNENQQYLRRDGGGGLINDTEIGALGEFHFATKTPPLGAVFAKVWVGLRSNGTTTDERVVDLLNVFAAPGHSSIVLPDAYPANEDQLGTVYQYAGILGLKADVLAGGAAWIDEHGLVHGEGHVTTEFDDQSGTETVTVTTAGTYYMIAGQTSGIFTPKYVGQQFLVLGTVSCYHDQGAACTITVGWPVTESSDGTTVADSMGYTRHSDDASTRWHPHHFAGIYYAGDTNGKRFRPRFTSTVNGTVVTMAFCRLVVIPLVADV
jgi:hypothetical protein